MQIFFHDDFLKQYTRDPAAAPGRLEPALGLVAKKYSLCEPQPANREEIQRVHTAGHWYRLAGDELLLHTALLAAGASLEAALTASNGGQAFALCRPPGHHASPDSCWGFCYFNNIAVAVKTLLEKKKAASILIVDFDLHYGDGTDNIFQGEEAVQYWHCRESARLSFLGQLEQDLGSTKADLLAISAGFDRHIDDWGGMLTTDDYRRIGTMLGAYARQECSGRVFATLEGGYNARSLAHSIDAFLDGLLEGVEATENK